MSSVSLPKRGEMIKAIMSTFSLAVARISSTSRATIGLPATGNRGLAVVSVWGRMRLPMPAMGMIIFISKIDFRDTQRYLFFQEYRGSRVGPGRAGSGRIGTEG